MKYLKSKQHYTNRYDKMTIDKCRDFESKCIETMLSDEHGLKKMNKEDSSMLFDLFPIFITYHVSGECYLEKEEIIKKWRERDAVKENLYQNAQQPEGITCLTCKEAMEPTFKDLHTPSDEDDEKVLFMYDCPNGHLPRRAFFHDGEEWISKPHLCPKCRTKLESENTKTKTKIITKDICNECGYVDTSEISLTTKKEKQDKNYAKDKKHFCMSEEDGKKYEDYKDRMYRFSYLTKEWEEKKKNKKLYDKVAKLKKLTLPQVEKLLTPLLEKEGYIHFSFAPPEVKKDVQVAFSVQDGREDRNELTSRHELKTLITKCLMNTNWRLMSAGIFYRLGILEGRLRGYEKEEDLLKLVSKQ